MSNWKSPLVLPAIIFPEMTEAEIATEIQLMFDRSEAIAKAISGNMPASELAELIRAQDFEVDSWIEDMDNCGGQW